MRGKIYSLLIQETRGGSKGEEEESEGEEEEEEEEGLKVMCSKDVVRYASYVGPSTEPATSKPVADPPPLP